MMECQWNGRLCLITEQGKCIVCVLFAWIDDQQLQFWVTVMPHPSKRSLETFRGHFGVRSLVGADRNSLTMAIGFPTADRA